MVARRTVLLLRHAQTEDTRPGGTDIDRALTAFGEEQARAVGAYLTGQRLVVDAVLCSAAVRARQTLTGLGLPLPDPSRTDISSDYYNAGSDTSVEALRGLDESCQVVLLVGHAPGVPAVAYELADPETSDPRALAAIDGRFPAAALARLEFTGAWADLETATLVDVRLPER
jgi:phosphohistidine phosphatase